MPRNGGIYLRDLQARLGRVSAGVDLPTALEHPDPATRVLAAGVVWERTGGRQPELALPVIAAALRSGEHQAVASGCRLLGDLGAAGTDLVPLAWPYLDHDDKYLRMHAAYALSKCCTDRLALAEVLSRLVTDTGDGLLDAVTAMTAERIRKAIEAEPDGRSSTGLP
jgi:hypothetical protein